MNALEGLSLTATLITIFGCIMLGVMEARESARIGVTICIFLLNVGVLCYFIYILVVEYIHTMRREADYRMQG